MLDVLNLTKIYRREDKNAIFLSNLSKSSLLQHLRESNYCLFVSHAGAKTDLLFGKNLSKNVAKFSWLRHQHSLRHLLHVTLTYLNRCPPNLCLLDCILMSETIWWKWKSSWYASWAHYIILFQNLGNLNYAKSIKIRSNLQYYLQQSKIEQLIDKKWKSKMKTNFFQYWLTWIEQHHVENKTEWNNIWNVICCTLWYVSIYFWAA